MKFLPVALALLSMTTSTLAHQAGEPVRDRFTLVRCGKLLDQPGKPPRANVTLVIKNGVVDRVIDGLAGPDLAAERSAGASIEELDQRERFVLPGLIDCHVHLCFEQTADARLRGVTETDADGAIRGVLFARRTVEAGFTTVRDCGSRGDGIFALRDGIARGDIPGPRILAAGKAVSVTGGHGDPSNGYDPALVGVPGPDDGVADGPDACMRAVRTQIKRGADVIKLTATGGVLSQSSASLNKHFTDAELGAIVQAAHSMGRKVCAHAHGTDGINAALRAGVDSIEHGSFQDDESIRLFKERGAWYVPTLLAGQTVVDNAGKPGYYHAFVARKAMEVGPKMVETFRKAHAAGVKIAFGTDSGVSAHGDNAKEFALMIKGGMSPSDAIVCATINAAECLGITEQVGSLTPGRSGDLIAVVGDPLQDVSRLEHVVLVMRAGVVLKK